MYEEYSAELYTVLESNAAMDILIMVWIHCKADLIYNPLGDDLPAFPLLYIASKFLHNHDIGSIVH